MDVTIYTTATCGYCKRAKQYFEENKIDYEERNLSINSGWLNDMKTVSDVMSVPVIVVKGSPLIGWNQQEFEKLYK